MNQTREIRALYAPVEGGGILLPGSVVAEVVEFTDPDPFKDAPDWLLGEIEWSGWQIPLINYAVLTDTGINTTITPRSRILIVKTLSGSTSITYIGFVINGLPRMINVSTGSLVETKIGSTTGAFSHVTIDDRSATIPDLDEIAGVIEGVAYRAL